MQVVSVRTYAPRVGHRPQCLVKVETDVGFSGWGEAGLSSREEAVAAAVGHYSELVGGRDPMERGSIWQRLYRSQYFEGGRVLSAAISAIDIALYDIAAQAHGVPVWELLGGRQRTHVPLFASIPPPLGPGTVAQAKRLVADGWQAIRLFPDMPPAGTTGGPGRELDRRTGARAGDSTADDGEEVFEPREALAWTAQWVTLVREAIGPGPTLGIDWHHRLSVAETVSFCQRLPPGTLDFLEEPIRAEDPEAYEQLRSMIDVPLAIGEEFSSKWAFAPFIERGLLDFVRLDICNVGGFTEALKVAGWAETHYLDLMPHNPLGPICTAATAHLCLAIANVAWMEIRSSPSEDMGFYDRDLFPVQPTTDGPRLTLSDSPGLGVEIDESLLEALPPPRWNPPRLRRRDGSVQNW